MLRGILYAAEQQDIARRKAAEGDLNDPKGAVKDNDTKGTQ